MRGNSTTALAGFNSSEVYHVRSCLYSCSSLKVLTLRSCNLEFCGNAQWNQLECLKIITTDVINQMLSVFGLLLFCHIMLTRFSNPLSQILPSVQHAENVTLSDCCTKVVDAMKMKCTRSAFPNVKSLELKCCYKQVVVTLEIFPQLERLVIENTSKMTPSRSSLRQFSLMSSPSSSVEDN
ncbi:uncharacterized protein LOC121747570 isoform X2 [Salvia splendens]|uniref:uncharacterized protein LOC121747570 isoform X2 n=1 Tax=Salvia splendens TaxID=180675 RepID=UPI001C272079|nr:uncharacterized protein LOC121747570 isoform X2 [Salvia splendens]